LLPVDLIDGRGTPAPSLVTDVGGASSGHREWRIREHYFRTRFEQVVENIARGVGGEYRARRSDLLLKRTVGPSRLRRPPRPARRQPFERFVQIVPEESAQIPAWPMPTPAADSATSAALVEGRSPFLAWAPIDLGRAM
jgi:hypothetical protein